MPGGAPSYTRKFAILPYSLARSPFSISISLSLSLSSFLCISFSLSLAFGFVVLGRGRYGVWNRCGLNQSLQARKPASTANTQILHDKPDKLCKCARPPPPPLPPPVNLV